MSVCKKQGVRPPVFSCHNFGKPSINPEGRSHRRGVGKMKRGSTKTVVTALAVIAMALSGEAFSMGSLSLSLPRAAVARAASPRPPRSSGILAASMSSVLDSRKASMVGQRACAAEATRTRRPNGYWKVFENVEAELLALVDELGLDGTMPTEAQLRKNNLSSLSDAMHEMGGFAHVAKRLGLKTSKPRGFWKDVNNVVSELESFLEGRDDNTLPTQAELRKAGRTDLISAMQAHGGMVAFADHLKLAMTTPGGKKGRKTGYSVRTQLEDHIKDFVKEHGVEGVMPSMQLLKSWGRTDLMRGIERHGGVEHMGRKCGLDIRRADQELVEIGKELYIIAKDRGDADMMPSLSSLAKEGRSDLVSVIERQGGAHQVACMIGMRAANPSAAAAAAKKAKAAPKTRTVQSTGRGRVNDAAAAAARTVAANRKSAADAVKSYSAAFGKAKQEATQASGAASQKVESMKEALKRKLSSKSRSDSPAGTSAAWASMF